MECNPVHSIKALDPWCETHHRSVILCIRETNLQLSEEKEIASARATRCFNLEKGLEDAEKQQQKTLLGLWQLLRAYAGGGMPPLVTKGIRLACQSVGMSEDQIASAELGGDDPDFIMRETEKRNDVATSTCACGFNSLICELHKREGLTLGESRNLPYPKPIRFTSHDHAYGICDPATCPECKKA